ncbi:hypothetical protein FDW84_06665 [Pseudarthrobacter sp. NamE5]|nr:hypothetical protein FDW84_06665 [Pseudarthrobacter sp. NamE5]
MQPLNGGCLGLHRHALEERKQDLPGLLFGGHGRHCRSGRILVLLLRTPAQGPGTRIRQGGRGGARRRRKRCWRRRRRSGRGRRRRGRSGRSGAGGKGYCGGCRKEVEGSVKTVTQMLEQGHQYDATPALDLNHPFACRQQPCQ